MPEQTIAPSSIGLTAPRGPGSGQAIAFEQVVKHWTGANRAAVNGVSLTIDPGALVVLLGPSGCGKTTLLKLINRLYEPDSGRILLNGESIASVPAPTLRRRIGYVIQQAGLFPHYRVEDNIATVPRLLGWDRARIDQRVDELLTLTGLPPAEYRRRYPAQLSGGEQQRVGIARALAVDPPTMLMDEPFGALDAITRARLQDELRAIHARLGQTIVFVTHDIEEAVRLADKIIVMRAGEVVQYDTPLRIVMHPADAFVAELTGANDVLRRLSLTPAGAIAEPLTEEQATTNRANLPTIDATQTARTALALLLESGAPRVIVLRDDQPVGAIDARALHRASTPATAA